MGVRSLLTVLLGALGWSGVSQADERSDFYKEYGPHFDRAYAHFLTNVRVAGVRKRYDTGGPGKYLCTQTFSAVAGEGTLLYRVAVSDNQTGGMLYPNTGGVVTADAGYEVSRAADSKKYALGEAGYPWAEGLYYGHYSTDESGLGWPFYSIYIGRGPNRYRALSLPEGVVFSAARRSYRDTACVAATQTTDRGSTSTIYLRLPDYLVIGHEATVRSSNPYRKYVEVNYGPPQPDTGLPFPTSVKGWYTTPDGKKTPAEDVTFTEYRRYTPTPDEVDIEKQFGVTPPPVPPRPPLPPEGEFLPDGDTPAATAVAARPGWPAWWLYAGAGVLAVLAAAVVAYARRRRRRTAAY